MTLSDIKTLLSSITGMTNKVVYYSFPIGQAPALPFICFYQSGENSFTADGKVYFRTTQIVVELYTENKDTVTESAVETALSTAGIIWNKSCNYLDSEKCWMTTYDFEV